MRESDDEKNPALTFDGDHDARWTVPGSPAFDAAVADRVEELRALIARDGDWLVPGWTLGEGEADVMASALLDRLEAVDAQTEAICAMIDGPANQEGER